MTTLKTGVWGTRGCGVHGGVGYYTVLLIFRKQLAVGGSPPKIEFYLGPYERFRKKNNSLLKKPFTLVPPPILFFFYSFRFLMISQKYLNLVNETCSIMSVGGNPLVCLPSQGVSVSGGGGGTLGISARYGRGGGFFNVSF